jgi:zinc protease
VAISSPQNSSKVDAAFFDEMSKVLKDGFSAEEVEKGKSALLQRRRLGRTNDATLAGQLSGALFIGRTLMADEELEHKIAALTADQVNAAMRRTIDPSKMTVILAGDFAKVQQAGKPQ